MSIFRQNYERLVQQLNRTHTHLSKDDIMRKAWVEHNKIVFEASNTSTLSPSSAAAGAGAGGSGNRITLTISPANQATLFYYYDAEANLLNYFVYNFGTNTISDFKEVTLDNSPNNSPVTEGGFFLYANNDENSNVDMKFIDLSGDIVWQDSSDNQVDVDIENFTRYVGAYYLKDGNWKLVLFDKDTTTKTFNFGEYHIEGGGYSYNDVWSGGIVVLEEVGTIRRYYIVNFSEGTKTQFHEVDNDLGDYLSVYQYAYSDKILTVKNGDLWEVFSSTGEKLTEFDAISEFSTASWSDYEFTFLDDDGSFLIVGYDNTNNYRTITLFSGSTDSFSSKVVDTSTYQYYDFDIFNQKDYDSTSDWNAEGAAIFLFYDTSNEPDQVRYYSPEGLILPIWSSDTELRDFYTFSNTRGINDNLDNSNISFSRSSDHICLLVDNNPSDENYSILRFNRTGSVVTVIPTDVKKTRVLDDDDQINGKTILQFERGFTVSGSWGWNNLSDVENRFYYSFYQANDESIDSNVIGQEFVMKDTVNDDYWAIKFLDWDGSPDGGFEYTRQLVSGGTFSGALIHFTFSNFEQIESDIISEGILELRRGSFGPIYNSAKEGESNDRNPSGTLWNSGLVYNLNSSYNYQWWYTDGSASNPTSSVGFNALFAGSNDGSGTDVGLSINWTDSSGKPGYLPSEYFAWQVDCLLKVDVAGNYLFNTTSDDGNQLTINGNVVTSFYGGRGFDSSNETSIPVNLSVGLHNFRYRMQNGGSESGARVQWQAPGDGTFSVIPSSNLVINEPITDYDHYIIGTVGQIIGSVSTGDDYTNNYEGKTYILEDRLLNKSWISNTQNSQNWTLLDKYYEEDDDVNNIIEPDGLRKGIYLLQNGFKYRVITEDSQSDEIEVPFTGSYLNKIVNDNIFHKGFFVRTEDETREWIRFYNIEGTLIETIEKEGEFDEFDSETRGDRCFISWTQDGTKRVAIFNGEGVVQRDTGYPSLDISINDYDWWD
jgi:hypothetical protein